MKNAWVNGTLRFTWDGGSSWTELVFKNTRVIGSDVEQWAEKLAKAIVAAAK